MSSSFPDFTPGTALCGGALIAMSALLYLVVAGRRAGISGIFSTGLLSLLSLRPLDPLSTTFLSAFFLAALAAPLFLPSSPPSSSFSFPPAAYLISGLLVGFGTRLGNGCTSGHGVCGLSRLSKRGAVAVLTFMTTGISVATYLGTHPHPSLRPSSSFPSKHDLPFSSQSWTPIILLLSLLLFFFKLPTKASHPPSLHLAAFLSGALFASGLFLSGMSLQAKVVNFLYPRVPGWDPSLLLVLGAAVGLLTPFSLYVLSHQPSAWGDPSVKLFADKGPLAVSKAEKVDWKLVVGEAVFGIGWGMIGLCPGPALVLLAQGDRKVVCFFMPLYVVGYLGASQLEGKKKTK